MRLQGEERQERDRRRMKESGGWRERAEAEVPGAMCLLLGTVKGEHVHVLAASQWRVQGRESTRFRVS
jgi:hypothetical protein